jgi:four helix bundle protein
MADSVKRLKIWQYGMNIVKLLYRLTKTWPKEERYGLTSQVRRAAVSIPANTCPVK